MRRNLIYSLLVFGLILSWFVSGAITQFFMGVLSSNDFGFALIFFLAIAGFFAMIFSVIFRVIRNKFYGGTGETKYHPSRRFAAVAVVLLTISIVGGITQFYSVGKKTAEAIRAGTQWKEDAEKVIAERREQEKQRLAAMTPEEREAETRKKEDSAAALIIQEGEAMLKRWKESEASGMAALAGKKLNEPIGKLITKQEWAAVKARLSSIKETQPQHQNAQFLLTAMADEEKKAAASAVVIQATARIKARKDFANNLEQTFIEKRMDTDVTVSGPKNTVLNIKWVLANKVTANDLSKSGILEQAENAGFKKVIFTDGYERQFWWSLKPKAEGR